MTFAWKCLFVFIIKSDDNFLSIFSSQFSCFIVSLQKIYLKKIALLFFLYRFAGSQFMTSIEIDADFTDADYDLQSQRMTDLDEEVCSLLLYF